MKRTENYVQMLRENSGKYADRAKNIACQDDYETFNTNLEVLHGYIHYDIGGDMSQLPTAPFDPIFWLHHNFIEKLYNEWQLCRDMEDNNDWHAAINDGDPKRLTRPLKCFNTLGIIDRADPTYSITALQVIEKRNEWCYKYDKLECQCAKNQQTRRRLATHARSHRAKSGAFAPATKFLDQRFYLAFTNERNFLGVFKYTVCKSHIENDYSTPVDQPIASDTLIFFGGNNHENQKNENGLSYYLQDITDLLETHGVSLASEITIELNSLTDYDGNDLSTDMVDLSPYNVIKPVDKPYIFKIFWGTKYKQPLVIHPGTYITFIGSENDKTVGEFMHDQAFHNCEKKNYQEYTTGSVMPSVGYHFYFNPSHEGCDDDTQVFQVKVLAPVPPIEPLSKMSVQL